MKGIILHGGHGTRLRPLTHTGPKQLLPIANKPMSNYCVDSLIEAGISDIAFIVGGIGAESVMNYYGNGENFKARFTYIKQDYPQGIAHAISLCRDFIGNEKFLVFLGDNIINKSIKKLVEEFEKSSAYASLLLCEVKNPSQFGVAYIKNNKIKKIIEKPKNPSSNLAVTGIYLLTPDIFEVIKNLKPSWRNELEIADALQNLIIDEKEIKYEIISNFWKDTGTPADILDANKKILEELNFNRKRFSGQSKIGENTKIGENVIINDLALIGKNCLIEKNTKIGENTSIDDECQIKECEIKNSIIMKNCKIIGPVVIENSIIASNSVIIKSNSEKREFLLGEGSKIVI